MMTDAVTLLSVQFGAVEVFCSDSSVHASREALKTNVSLGNRTSQHGKNYLFLFSSSRIYLLLICIPLNEV